MKKITLIFTTTILLSCALLNNSSEDKSLKEPIELPYDKSLYCPMELSDYVQAPGFYSNNEYFSIKNNAQKVLDFPIGGGTTAPNNDSIITLGEAGGYIVVKFDPPIANSTIGNAYDFIVYGNTFWIGNDSNSPNMEPGFVEVKSNLDDEWNLLLPEESRSNTTKHKITYSKASYNETQWPTEASESITLSSWKSDEYTNKGGYCEISPTLKKPDNQNAVTFYANPDIRGGGDPFKLEWAVDSHFNPVVLTEISYIKITTGIYNNGDLKSATEVDAIIRINYEDI